MSCENKVIPKQTYLPGSVHTIFYKLFGYLYQPTGRCKKSWNSDSLNPDNVICNVYSIRRCTIHILNPNMFLRLSSNVSGITCNKYNLMFLLYPYSLMDNKRVSSIFSETRISKQYILIARSFPRVPNLALLISQRLCWKTLFLCVGKIVTDLRPGLL